MTHRHTGPEAIHPALWRGSQLAQASGNALPTGFAQLDAQLPGGGWPLGALAELAPIRPGIGEVSLLCPAFSRLPPERRIVLVQPPHMPQVSCWRNWRLDPGRLLWVQPSAASDALWACEQILRHNVCAALVCWIPRVPHASLRRLHLAARQSDTLFILMQPPGALQHPSPAPLRIGLRPAPQGLELELAKRRGPHCDQPVFITLHSHAHHPAKQDAALDRPAPAPAQPGRAASLVAH